MSEEENSGPTIDTKDYSITYPIKLSKTSGEIKFISQDGKLVVTITRSGYIKFNREEFPDLCEDEFANKVLDILEGSFPKIQRTQEMSDEETKDE